MPRRLFDLLLRCYPEPFRRRFGAELRFAFRAEWQKASARGFRAALALLAGSVADVIVNGIRERRSNRWYSYRARRDSVMQTLWTDVKYGVRLLVRDPGFGLVAIATLGLGIGLSAAILSVAYDVLLRPLPYNDETRVVTLVEFAPSKDILHGSDTPANFIDWRAQASSFSHMGALAPYSATIVEGSEAVRVDGRRVTPDVLLVLGIQPLLGRVFSPEDDRVGNGLVLLSHRVWRSQFGADPGIVGRSILVNEKRRSVIGVLRPEFRLPEGDDAIFVPMAFSQFERQARKSHFVTVIARLKDGVTLDQASTDMMTIAAGLAAAYPDANKGQSVLVEPIRDTMVGDARTGLLVLAGAVMLVLLIACVNVSSLLLVRATRRHQEIAVRTALGAGRWRLVRQLLAESALLATIAGAAGVVVAWWTLLALRTLVPDGLTRGAQLEINPAFLCAAAAVGAGTALVFGLAPALHAAQRTTSLTVREGRATASRATTIARQALVAAQIALAVVLLAGTGLLMRSFWRLTAVDPGFSTGHLLTLRMELPRARYEGPAQWAPLLDRIVDELEAIPGVTSVAGISWLPLSTSGNSNAVFVEGRPLPGPNENTYAIYRLVTPGYFKTMHIPVVAGREFSRDDRAGGLRVGVVNRTMAERLWPGESAVGKRLSFSRSPGPGDSITVVGVAGDTHFDALDAPNDLELYAPGTQDPYWFPPSDLAIRTSVAPTAVAAAVRERLHAIDPMIPVSGVQTMESLVAATVSQPRFQVLVVGTLGGTALVLATIGIYGLLAFSVAVREREFGVRAALGATPLALVRMVVLDGMRLAGAGIVVGIALAVVAVRSLRTLLFQVDPADTPTFVAMTALLLVVSLAACYLPARRAARLDPLLAIRSD